MTPPTPEPGSSRASCLTIRCVRGPPIPDRFYKFMTREHAEAMCTTGQFRVGTLYEYRNAEQYTDGVLDESEGTLRVTDTLDWVTKETMGEHSPITQRAFGLDEHVIINGLQVITAKHTSPDRFIYCVSESSDWSASSDPKYDACVEIWQGERFFQGIVDTLGREAYGGALKGIQGVRANVLYGSRDYDWKEKPPPPEVVKEPKYQNQREWRGIWFPQIDPIKPVVLRSPEIAKSVRLFATR